MKTIPAVPESITREAYLALVAAAGFEPKDVRKLEFRVDGIYAEAYDRPEVGGFRIDESTSEAIVNRVWIPVQD